MPQIYIEKLAAKNFRNLDFDSITFSKNINCIFGQNGNGKTNLLEAIYFLFTHKSFRKKAGFSQIISMDSESPQIVISGVLDNDGELCSYSGKWSLQGQSWYLNNTDHRKKLDQVIILVNPFDANQFYQIPAFRRDWFNNHFSYYSSEFKTQFKNYNKLLKMKNALLSKSYQKDKTQLLVINKELAILNFQILNKKQEILSELNQYLTPTFKRIFDENHELNLKIESKLSSLSVNELEDRLNEYLEKEMAIGHSIFGIHRDDFTFKFNGLNAFDFCSLGQQKMSYLSLLFAYTELFRYKFKAYPIIFVDDVSGELDNLRWERLIGFLKDKNFQVFITTANDGFKKILENIDKANKIYIKDGQLISKN